MADTIIDDAPDIFPEPPPADDHAADELRCSIRSYLETLPTTLWGRAWDLHNPNSVDGAVEWFANQVEMLADFMEVK